MTAGNIAQNQSVDESRINRKRVLTPTPIWRIRVSRQTGRLEEGKLTMAKYKIEPAKPRLLDLFCGAGGAAMGYHRAGFDVVGMDINPQPNYPFQFIEADCLTIENFFGITAIHASPPCQSYTRKTATWGRARVNEIKHPDLLAATREMLEGTGLPYVIENVMGAPMRRDIVLCGTQFGLRIIKHRQFEANWPLRECEALCDHSDVYNPWSGKGRSAAEHRLAQGTPWIPTSGGASRAKGKTGDLNNAIPPAYTEFIGKQLMAYVIEKAKK